MSIPFTLFALSIKQDINLFHNIKRKWGLFEKVSGLNF